MLIHLVTRDHGFATFPPPDAGAPRVSGSAFAFTAINLCNAIGLTMPIDAAELRSETIVTLRDQLGRYLMPQGDQVRLAFVTAAQSKFLLRKVNGQPGEPIHHGDAVALGAFTSTPMKYRWLQLDSRLQLGGLTKTFGGSTQRPTMLFVDDAKVFGSLKLSDELRAQKARTQTGTITIDTPQHAIQKDSFFDIKVDSITSARYAIASSPLHGLPAGGETVEARVREGERSATFPVKFDFPVNFDEVPEIHPCRLHASGTGFPTMLKGSMTFRPIASWAGTKVERSFPSEFDIRMGMAFDFMTLEAGTTAIDEFGIARIRATGGSDTAPFTLTVRNGSTPIGTGEWFCALSIEPFPIPNSIFSTTANTPVPPRAPSDPVLKVAADGHHFEHRFEFLEMPPLQGHHLFSCMVLITARGRNPKQFRRRFALEIGLGT